MLSPDDASTSSILAQSIELPCGRRIPNRLVKAAMEEVMSSDRLPNVYFERLYRAWSEGGFGMIISGNVQVSWKHLGLPLDVAVPASIPAAPSELERFAAWAASMDTRDPATSPLRIMQLNHPGRQSMRFMTGRSPFDAALAPSTVPMTAGRGQVGKFVGTLVWDTPKEMTLQDVAQVVDDFRRGADLAKASGWDGVQLHASHGYLLAQFLSPRTNLRSDEYGGNGRKRLRILLEIADAIRKDHPVSSGFVLGVKLNASDYIQGGLTEEDALENVRWIAEHGGFDFVEISGGSYEAPEFLSMKPSTSRREAFFADFSSRAYRLLNEEFDASSLSTPKPLVLLTGGFRTRSGMRQALEAPVADLIGVGRPAAVDPHFGRKLLDPNVPDDEAVVPSYDANEGTTLLRWLFSWMTLFGPSLDVFYHNLLMHSIAFDSAAPVGSGNASRTTTERQDRDANRTRRLAPFWTLVRRNYLDPSISPTAQRLASWSLVGIVSLVCLARFGPG